MPSKLFLRTLLFIALFPLQACSDDNQSSATQSVDPLKIDKVMDIIKTELKVKDLMYDATATVQWNIGVISDGTKQHGYASYICDVLKDNDVVTTRTIVRVTDIQKVVQQNQTPRQASLGSVDCNTYEFMNP
jgi:N12 class adenine-specific DNA methylase